MSPSSGCRCVRLRGRPRPLALVNALIRQLMEQPADESRSAAYAELLAEHSEAWRREVVEAA